MIEDAHRTVTLPAGDIMRSMQYMNARNGGLLIEFRPIERYLHVAPAIDPHERVRTVLDWIAFAVELGLLSPKTWQEVFARPDDWHRFAQELRQYDAEVSERHRDAFAALGVIESRQTAGYAGLAEIIDQASVREEAA